MICCFSSLIPDFSIRTLCTGRCLTVQTVAALPRAALVTQQQLSLSSCPIFLLQRASGFVGIHRPCQQLASACYILLLITDVLISLVSPISQPLLSGSSSQVDGGSLAGYEVIQSVSVRVAHAAFGQSAVLSGENVIRRQI